MKNILTAGKVVKPKVKKKTKKPAIKKAVAKQPKGDGKLPNWM